MSEVPRTTDGGRLLTIGELARSAGVSPEVIRAWEMRHGFPVATRLPSGHRRYRESDAEALREVLEKRDGGLRLDAAISAVTAPREPSGPAFGAAGQLAAGSTGSVLADLKAQGSSVATVELVDATPAFARIAVSPANSADRQAARIHMRPA